jgi:hypothetical protein
MTALVGVVERDFGGPETGTGPETGIHLVWPKPNTRDTKGKLRGSDFAEGARDEAKEAESRVKE